MTTSITRELRLLRYSKILPSSFNDIQLSEEIGESISTDKITRWDSGNAPISYPSTVVVGDKVRISNSTITVNAVYTIASISTINTTNDTITVTPDNGIDTIGNGTRTVGGVGNLVIFREANTTLGSITKKFEKIYTKSLEAIGTFILPNPTAQATSAPPTQDNHLVNKLYADSLVAPIRILDDIVSTIVAGTQVIIPDSKTYFGDHPLNSNDKVFSRYLTIYVDATRVYAGGIGYERDYKESGTDSTGQNYVTFEFDLVAGSRVEYIIYKP